MSQQGWNRNQIKYFVVLAMVIDHIAWGFVPTPSFLGQMMHCFGRLTGPVMCFFLAQGFMYTRNKVAYGVRLAVFGLLSWGPFVYFLYGCGPIVFQGKDGISVISEFGMIYTLLLGYLALCLWAKEEVPILLRYGGVAVLCLLSCYGDWPILGVVWPLVFYQKRENVTEMWQSYLFVGILCLINIIGAKPWWSNLYLLGIILVIPLLQFGYNGLSGKKSGFHRWFFYFFYPIHLIILGFLRWQVF